MVDPHILHKDPNMVTQITNDLNSEFGKEAPKIHDYPGMTLNYSIPGKVQLKMFDYIKNYWKNYHQTWMGLSIHLPQITFSSQSQSSVIGC